jgi:hypothetical protein
MKLEVFTHRWFKEIIQDNFKENYTLCWHTNFQILPCTISNSVSKTAQFNVALKWWLSAHRFYSIHKFTFNKTGSARITQQRVLCVRLSCMPTSIIIKKNTVVIIDFMANSRRRTETIQRTSIFVWSSPYSCPIFQTWTFSTDFHKTPPAAKFTEVSTGSRAGICGGFYLLFLETFILSLHHSATGLYGHHTNIRINTFNPLNTELNPICQ